MNALRSPEPRRRAKPARECRTAGRGPASGTVVLSWEQTVQPGDCPRNALAFRRNLSNPCRRNDENSRMKVQNVRGDRAATSRWSEFPERTWSEFSEPADVRLGALLLLKRSCR